VNKAGFVFGMAAWASLGRLNVSLEAVRSVLRLALNGRDYSVHRNNRPKHVGSYAQGSRSVREVDESLQGIRIES